MGAKLSRVYDEFEFDDDAVSEMASTFAGKQAMTMMAGTANGGQAAQAGVELFQQWKVVCDRHGVTDEWPRKALVLQGMDQFINDSREQSIAEMASVLEEM